MGGSLEGIFFASYFRSSSEVKVIYIGLRGEAISILIEPLRETNLGKARDLFDCQKIPPKMKTI